MRCFNDLPARELALPGPLVEFMAFAFAVRFKQGSGSWGDVMLVHCNPVRATQLGWTKHLEQRRPLTGDFTRPARPARLRPRNLALELSPLELAPGSSSFRSAVYHQYPWTIWACRSPQTTGEWLALPHCRIPL